MEAYQVAYNAKDLIIYALSLGMGSSADDSNELKFLYEQHENFTGVPTFCFAFTFWAQKQKNAAGRETSTQRIPPFPPPIMSEAEVIPRRFLREKTDISDLPVIHTWQSIAWHQPMEIPKRNSNLSVKYIIKQEVINILPKSIGTFVTTQTEVVAESNGKPSCSLQSTALVLGVDPKKVIPYDAGVPKLTHGSHRLSQAQRAFKKQPLFQWTYQTSQSQALLYRMASGDSNHIHVDTSASDMLGRKEKTPLLHGLFTLALAFRAIVKYFDSDDGRSSLKNLDDVREHELSFRKFEGRFKAPAFVGDKLSVKIWDDDHLTMSNSKGSTCMKRLFFVVVNHTTGATLVDNGCAEVDTILKKMSSTERSRL